MDEGVGDAAFMDEAVGNGWATQHPETTANGAVAEAAKTARIAGQMWERPQPARNPGDD